MRADPCCAKCRTPSGVCATKRTCQHHVFVREREEAESPPDHPDPTGETAAYRADNEPRRWSG